MVRLEHYKCKFNVPIIGRSCGEEQPDPVPDAMGRCCLIKIAGLVPSCFVQFPEQLDFRLYTLTGDSVYKICYKICYKVYE
jgi:hypothetical protein